MSKTRGVLAGAVTALAMMGAAALTPAAAQDKLSYFTWDGYELPDFNKSYVAAHPDATLEVIGRRGWGDDWDVLSTTPGVILHGFQPDNDATAILARADILICTSHEEGLGLPLLEAQYAGLPVVAPDQPVFREVLDRSGVFIDTRDPRALAYVRGHTTVISPQVSGYVSAVAVRDFQHFEAQVSIKAAFAL